MFQHVAVHEHDSTASTLRNQDRAIYGGQARFQVVDSHGCSLRIKTYANNEARVTWSPVQPAKRRDDVDAGTGAGLEAVDTALVYNAKVQHSGFECLAAEKRRRGQKPTRYAMHTVREACSILEGLYEKDCHFITLTLPGRTPNAIGVFAQESTGIMNAFMQRYRHFLKECAPKIALAHLPIDGVGAFENNSCWVAEYHKDGTLHYHVLIGVRDKLVVRVLRKLVKKWWRNVLLHYSKKTGVDLFERKDGGSWKDCESKPRTQFAKVKKSVAAYMGKYLSKIGRANVDENWMPPAKWYHVSTPLMERVVAKRNFNAITLLTKEHAEQKAAMFVEIGQAAGAKVYPMKNPYTEELCGFVLFFDGDGKDAVYNEWSRYVDTWRQEYPEVQPRAGPQALDCLDEQEAEVDVLEIFQGRYLTAREKRCAALCAPFSAPEKGGGMRYNQ